MRAVSFLCIAFSMLFVFGCAKIEHKQLLAEPIGRDLTVPVGGTIATMNKQKDLPNVFGKADIYGRKVDIGFTKLVYEGPSAGGGVAVAQIDVDVLSNADVFTRMPAMAGSYSSASVYGNQNYVSGSGSSNSWAYAPRGEQNIVLPPNARRFTIPKGRTLTLQTGQRIEFISVEPHQLTYRIIGDQQ